MRRRLPLLPAFVATVLTLAVASVPLLAVPSSARADGVSVGARLPEIGLVGLDGKKIDRKSLAGKVVIIDFWATWCAPCKEELPVLQRLYEKYGKDGLVVVGISVDKEAKNVRSFVKKLKLTFPVAHDADHAVSGRYEPATMPSSYVVDRKGVVRHVHKGYRAGDDKKIESEVKALLGK